MPFCLELKGKHLYFQLSLRFNFRARKIFKEGSSSKTSYRFLGLESKGSLRPQKITVLAIFRLKILSVLLAKSKRL